MKIERVWRKDLSQHRWKIDVTINGQRIRRADFETKREAIEAIAALQTSARADRYGLVTPKPKVTLRDLKSSVTKDQTRPQTLQIFTEFVNLVGHEVLLTSLTKADWKKYTDFLRDRDCQPRTINRYLAEVSGVLSSASERFPDLGDWRPPKAPWLSVPPGRERLLSKEEIAKILMALRSKRQKFEQSQSVKHRLDVVDLFRLMLLTAAREGEILGLTQNQISWDWRTVRIESRKGGGSIRVVPLSDTALEILKSRPPDLFKTLNTNHLYTALERASQISGVEYGDRVLGGWVIYDLRHVAATVLENSGIPYSAVSTILGHKRRDQTATYTHADLSTMRRGVESLETWCREIDGFISGNAENRLDALILRQQAGH